MENQKYNLGDIVKVVVDDQDNEVRIGKIVSISYCKRDTEKYCYGVSFDLNGIEEERTFLDGDDFSCLAGWIDCKVTIENC